MKSLFIGILCGLVLFVSSQVAIGQAPAPAPVQDDTPPIGTVERECKQKTCTLDGPPPAVTVNRFKCGRSEEDLHCSNTLGPNCNWTCTDY